MSREAGTAPPDTARSGTVRSRQLFAGRGPRGLVLAAGAGRRLGLGPKALLLSEEGLTLAEAITAVLLRGGCTDVTVVTGAGGDEVESALEGHDRVSIAHNPDWSSGMGSSLRCGLRSIGPGHAVMITPVDRPGICAAEVARLIAAHRPDGITAAAHRDANGELRRGHPVLFDASWTVEAAAAGHGDVGARDLLEAHADVVDLIDCSDLDDGADVDVPADLHRLRVIGSAHR